MNSSFEYITTLEYRLRAAKAELEAFRSGEKYIRMEELRLKEVRALERRVEELEKELGKARTHAISIRNQWFEIFELLQKECDKKVAAVLKEKELMEARALKAEAQRDEALDKVKGLRQKNYELESSLEEEKGKVQKLTAQLNHDYKNSSLPSSMTIKKKKISNSRKTTGRRPGGQLGHKGHGRRKQDPTEVVLLPPPQEVLDDPDFKKTKKRS